jgi:hypothetical protein
MHYWEVQVFYHFFTGMGGHSSEVVQILGKGGYSRDVRPCVPTPATITLRRGVFVGNL